MKPPDPPPPDPLLQAQEKRAEADNIAALQVQAQGDTASLMARYGTRLAIAGAVGGSPLSSASPAMPIGPFAGVR